MYDVVIIGGGPAGLSAALVLGRCRRRVLVCDAGTPRNAASSALHGYLTRDGMPPLEFLRLAREELRPYGTHLRSVRVTDIARVDDGFEVSGEDGTRERSRSVLIATGVRDALPAIPGIDECYGISVHHCPYCDGWEHGGKRIAVIGQATQAAGLALAMKTWSDDVILCTGGAGRLRPEQRTQLKEQGITFHESRIARVLHEHGRVHDIELAGGGRVPCEAIFFSTGQSQQSNLAERLGCEFTRKGAVKTDLLGETCVPGVFVVGDASRDVQFVVVAAAEGAKAGVAINKALQARAGLAIRTLVEEHG